MTHKLQPLLLRPRERLVQLTVDKPEYTAPHKCIMSVCLAHVGRIKLRMATHYPSHLMAQTPVNGHIFARLPPLTC
jgi:hypothetical protein